MIIFGIHGNDIKMMCHEHKFRAMPLGHALVPCIYTIGDTLYNAYAGSTIGDAYAGYTLGLVICQPTPCLALATSYAMSYAMSYATPWAALDTTWLRFHYNFTIISL